MGPLSHLAKPPSGRLQRLDRTSSARSILRMSKSQMSAEEESDDGKRIKAPVTQPKATIELAQEHAPEMISEGDRILGMTKENSGWDVYNNEARKVDTELVKDWTTSLNFLLIFAAIFAAVLTAFIIESKRMLELDPMNTMVDIMIFYTNSVANGTHTPYTRTEFEPDTSAVVVNCLFFASLSASLFAALASVVALQWVADYDAAITRGGSSPEDRAKRRQFRYAGIISWKMSEIIAALPLLLYFSVILFFAGLILWMWVTNHAVGAVVAGGTTVAVLFYITSTVIAVTFVSAPFRTPLSRWIYTLFCLPFPVLYWLMSAMRISTIPSWIKARRALHTTSYRREDQAVEDRQTLGRDALVWLANQLSISQDSYQRLLFLVGELASLGPEQLPSFDRTEALWYRIFDLLGWGYLRRNSSATVSSEEKRRGIEILQRCYRLPAIKNLVDPVKRVELTKYSHEEYWSQYCDSADTGQWMTNHDRPNHLFLLLRDIPGPSQFSTQEIDVTARLSQWRNQTKKSPQAWDEVFSDTSSLPSEFFSLCVTTFANFCCGERWYKWDDSDREIYTSLARKVARVAARRNDLQPVATILLMRAYTALLSGYGLGIAGKQNPGLTMPFQYGVALQQGSGDDHAAHAHMTLVLSRQLNSDPKAKRASPVKNIISMLWLRPSNPVPRDWNSLREAHGRDIPVDLMSDWIRNADSVPHILEILRHLAEAQKADPSTGPLWRSTYDYTEDPHFVEALQAFDRLMGMGCTADDHCLLVNLVCQDFELYGAFYRYFTPSRLESLALLKDDCLRILVICARGRDFLSPVVVPEAYGKARRKSLDRVAKYVYNRFSSIDSPGTLQLHASLWPMASRESSLCEKAMQDTVVFDYMQRMFKYPVPCGGCFDGPDHLVSHLLSLADVCVKQEATFFGEIPLKGRRMPLILAIISTLSDVEALSLASYFPEGEKTILQTLERDIREIMSSQFHLLVMLWNTLAQRTLSYPGNIGAIVIGIRKALQLPYDSRSTAILAPLSLKIAHLRDTSSSRERGMFVEQEVVKGEVNNTIQLLLTTFAVRLLFGRYNMYLISCARAVGDDQPAVGWLKPYEG